MKRGLFFDAGVDRHRRRPRQLKSVISVTLAVSMATLSFSVASAAVKPKQSLANVSLGASTSSVNNLPVWVGQADGYYQQQGLNLKFVLLTASTVIAALTSNSVNFLTASSANFLQAKAAGDPVVAIDADDLGLPLGIVISNSYAAAHGFTASTPLTKIAKAMIGSTGGASAPSTLAQSYLFLEQFGVQPSQVSVATLASPAADEAALEKGQIQWFVTSEPIPLEMQAQGFGIVVGNPKSVPNWSPRKVGIGQMLVATSSYIAANPGTVRKFVKASEAATAEISKHEQKVLSVAQANSPGVPRTVLLKSYDIVSWPLNGKMNANQWRTTVAFNVKEGLVPHGFKVNEGTDWTNKFT